jgi:hypothetical protein
MPGAIAQLISSFVQTCYFNRHVPTIGSLAQDGPISANVL